MTPSQLNFLCQSRILYKTHSTWRILMIAKRLNQLNPYVPGEQPTDREYIKLNANENPYPPSPNVINEISNFVNSNGMKFTFELYLFGKSIRVNALELPNKMSPAPS